MKKILFILSLFVLVTGCSKNELTEFKNNTDVKAVESYVLNVTIAGSYERRDINETFQIKNFKNDQLVFSITEKEENLNIIKDYIYQNKKVYIFDEDSFVEVNKDLKFTNVSYILKSLDEISKIEDMSREVLGSNEYVTHLVEFNEEYIDKLLADNDLEADYEVAKGKVSLLDGKVANIQMYLGDLNLSFKYSMFGQVQKINIK